MQNRRIPNNAITASSSWDANHAPYLGRLHFTARGKFQGAWSSRYNNHFQFFQVDFRKPTKVSQVATQGRQNANQWVTQYRLAYSQDGMNWALYKLRDAIKVRRIVDYIITDKYSMIDSFLSSQCWNTHADGLNRLRRASYRER